MKMVVTSRVNADGILTLTVPLGAADANKVVRVCVETLEGATSSCRPGDRPRRLAAAHSADGGIDH